MREVFGDNLDLFAPGMYIRDRDVYGKMLYDPSIERFFTECSLASYLVTSDHSVDKYMPRWHPYKINNFFTVDSDPQSKKSMFAFNPKVKMLKADVAEEIDDMT